MQKLSKSSRELLIQFIEYLISGGAYFWSGYLVFALLWSGLRWSLWWAKLGANIFGWAINFILQRYWVFRNPHLSGHFGQVSGRYIVISLIDFVMDFFIIYGLRLAGITPYIGNFISAGFFTVWNYFWYRFWVFPIRIPAPRHPAKKHLR
ncbi:MAG: GtrA family protein [Candidatus Saccharimonadales bacterium]